MGWNYRVVRGAEVGATGEAVVVLGIHEVYYRNDAVDDRSDSLGEVGLSATPVAVRGESIEDLRTTLELMLAALDKPVLDYGEEGAP